MTETERHSVMSPEPNKGNKSSTSITDIVKITIVKLTGNGWSHVEKLLIQRQYIYIYIYIYI
jgi:hypothetical protein